MADNANINNQEPEQVEEEVVAAAEGEEPAEESGDDETVPTDQPMVGADGVEAALATCGANRNQIKAIKGEGITQMTDFLFLNGDRVMAMATNLTKLPNNRGGARIGAILTEKIRALVFWCHERRREDSDLDAAEFSPRVMLHTLERMGVEEQTDEAAATLPKNFKPVNWVDWSKKFENYLKQVKGRNDVPLYYVIRKDRDEQEQFSSEMEEKIYLASHRGERFRSDNRKVFQLLTELLSGTPAWTWISKFERAEDGKKAMKALRSHYDGPGEVEKRVAYAFSELETAHYKSERVFPFESYVTKLSEAFGILEDNRMHKEERERVEYLLKGIQSDNFVIVSAKTTVRMNENMRNSFQLAVDKLSEVISATFTRARVSTTGNKAPRRVSQAKSNRKGKDNGSGNVVNGVDISDLTRNFSKKEWFDLPKEVRERILEARKKKKENKRKVSKVNVNESGTGSDSEEDDQKGNGTRFGTGAYKKSRNN